MNSRLMGGRVKKPLVILQALSCIIFAAMAIEMSLDVHMNYWTIIVAVVSAVLSVCYGVMVWMALWDKQL